MSGAKATLLGCLYSCTTTMLDSNPAFASDVPTLLESDTRKYAHKRIPRPLVLASGSVLGSDSGYSPSPNSRRNTFNFSETSYHSADLSQSTISTLSSASEDTAQKLRSEVAHLSRALREESAKFLAASQELEASQAVQSELVKDLERLCSDNFTLSEHNKLLSRRDKSLHEDIAALLAKSREEDWARGLLEDQLEKARLELGVFDMSLPQVSSEPLRLTIEDGGPLLVQLSSAKDELHITRLRLERSERRRKELEGRLSVSQRNMGECVDTTSEALDVERGLRNELSLRCSALEREVADLKEQLDSLSSPPKIRRKGPQLVALQKKWLITNSPPCAPSKLDYTHASSCTSDDKLPSAQFFLHDMLRPSSGSSITLMPDDSTSVRDRSVDTTQGTLSIPRQSDDSHSALVSQSLYQHVVFG